MEINKIYNGFKLINKKEIKELDSTLYEFHHEYSGATLVFLENDDTNKCFSIGFRTPPEDSTGVCHIIEHSVLCGSKKYPVKEPFVNLLKGSMASFLNAMTASDCTVYPVASPNDIDFFNLMSVYLDAVFAPLSVTDPKPFLQEGWHYEMNNVDSLPSYKGIVYNEMQGAMSSPTSQLYEYVNQYLYQGSCYQYNSGGDPDVIPTLTYDYYKEFYHKHYHPSNSLIYLYGKVDLDNVMSYIDAEYLSKFKDTGERVELAYPISTVNTEIVKEYSINEEESLENNSYISLAYGLDHAKNVLDTLGLSLLSEALMGTNASPLKKVLIEKELATEISAYLDDSAIVPTYCIVLEKTSPEKKELFLDTFYSELRRLSEEGIDKELLLATININEFRNKEADSGRMPKGLIYAFSLMQGFNYGIPYNEVIEMDKYYKYFKENLDYGYFENLIKKYILNSNHYVLVTMNPSKEIGKIKADELNKKMLQLKENMTSEEAEEYVRITEELLEYQSKKDDIEDVKKIPSLKLEDVSTDIKFVDTKIDGNIIYHNVNTNKISYMNLFFDLNVLEFDDLPYAKILAYLLVKLDTEKYSVDKLQNKIKTYLGGLSFGTVFSAINKDECISKMMVSVSALDENTSYIPEILNDVINNSVFDEDKIKTILNQIKNREKSSALSNGVSIASLLVREQLSTEGLLLSKTSGYNFYNFISNVVDNFDEKFINKLKEVCDKVFNKNNVIVSLSGNCEALEKLTDCFNSLELSDKEVEYVLKAEKSNNSFDALVIPSGVNANVMGINLKDLGYEENGCLHVIRHILNYDYLWPEVRVKGGAYGCSLSVSLSGDLIFGSHSDPNVTNTFDVYDNVAKYLEDFEPTEEEFINYLIGAVAKVNPPASVYSRISQADKGVLCNVSQQRLEKLSKEILKTTVSDVKTYSSLFKKIAQLSHLFTVGNEEKINECSRFTNVRKLI